MERNAERFLVVEVAAASGIRISAIGGPDHMALIHECSIHRPAKQTIRKKDGIGNN